MVCGCLRGVKVRERGVWAPWRVCWGPGLCGAGVVRASCGFGCVVLPLCASPLMLRAGCAGGVGVPWMGDNRFFVTGGYSLCKCSVGGDAPPAGRFVCVAVRELFVCGRDGAFMAGVAVCGALIMTVW